MPHVIRLRGPWEFELADAEQVLRGEISVPTLWSAFVPADYAGRITLLRRFGRPTGLEQSPRVSLAVDSLNLPGVVFLNGDRLGEFGNSPGPVHVRWEVMSRLLPRNELRLEFSELPRGPLLESTSPPNVWLEIEAG